MGVGGKAIRISLSCLRGGFRLMLILFASGSLGVLQAH